MKPVAGRGRSGLLQAAGNSPDGTSGAESAVYDCLVTVSDVKLDENLLA